MTNSRNDRMLGESSAFLEVQEHVSRIAPLTKPVLVVGERGTGKELIAARIHYLSERWGQPYLKINCASISDSLLESELFGHEAGAFSGATKRHLGYFERAHGGTLFLDELATTSVRVQEKILRLIEYGELMRVGGDAIIEVDVRLVAATNADLPSLVAKDQFRADLLDRLAFDVITLPPLRARADDIPLLAEFFALGMAKELGWSYFPGFTESALQQLEQYSWPGNVRELKNAVERSIYRSEIPEEAIDAIILNPFCSPHRPAYQGEIELAETSQATNHVAPLTEIRDLKQHVENIEINILTETYRRCHYSQKKTAEQLGLSYHQLRAYFKKYRLGKSTLEN